MSILDDSLSSFQSSDHHHSSGAKKKLPKGMNGFLIGAVAVVAVFAVVISVQLAQRSQENRQSASVANGQVLVTSATSPVAPHPNQQTTLTLKANTQGVQIDGIQLSFTIAPAAGQALTGAPVVSVISGSGMNFIISPIITANPNGSYQVVFGVAPPIPNSFSSTTPVDFATIAFTPNAVGTVNLQFSATVSKATIHDSPTAEDTLRTIQPMNVVIAAVTNTPTNTPNASASGTLTNTPTRTPTRTPTNTPTRTPTNTPIVLATNTPTQPPGTTTAPTATVAAGTCNTIMVSYVSTGLPNTSPRRGDTINFTCGLVNGAVRYEFRLREPGSSTYITLGPVSTGSRISQPYTITQAGDFSGQCRMCTGAAANTCQAWE